MMRPHTSCTEPSVDLSAGIGADSCVDFCANSNANSNANFSAKFSAKLPRGAAASYTRRAMLGVLGAGVAPALLAPSLALADQASAAKSNTTLDAVQSLRFRQWLTLLIQTQIERGPTPRWTHRDCAGLVRFAAAESLRTHDVAWRKANGLLDKRVPPDIDAAQCAALRNQWRRSDGSRNAYVSAIELVQENTRSISRQLNQANLGDLLFFDQGDDQHLMVWMGSYIAYHTGHATPEDNGLRALPPSQLLHWKDTRWRPNQDNSNFLGVFRFSFLSA